MEEIWREIPGFPEHYQASNLGRVRSLAHLDTLGRRRAEKMLGGWLSDDGYPKVKLADRGMSVHTAVALAFLGPKPEGFEVLHYDDIKTNNSIANLRYGTSSENMDDKVRNGRHHYASQQECVNGHRYEGESFYVQNKPNGRTRRVCRVCIRANTARYRRRLSGLC